MPQQGSKTVIVEGRPVRVPMDATPDEIDQISGGAPPPQPSPQAYQKGAMQRQPGGPVFTPRDIQRGVVDRALKSGDYETIARIKEGEFAQDFPKGSGVDPRAYAAQSVPWMGAGMNPVTNLKFIAGTIPGTIVGGAAGRYIGGPKYGGIGAGLGGLVGGLYGGFRAASDQPLLSGKLANLAKLSRWGKGLSALLGEEPAAASGAAREAAGGTAATTGPAGESTQTALGSQAGPSGPKNAGELSATVQRIRGGQGPGTAASSPTIYTPESLASEQGMSTAALGKGGFNLTIPPAQQEIMRRVAEAPPGTFTPKPAQGFESLGRTSPFPNAPPMNPPSGTSPSFGEPEGPIDAAIRGAAGQNPVIKSTDKAMAGEMPSKIKFMNLIRKKAQEGR